MATQLLLHSPSRQVESSGVPSYFLQPVFLSSSSEMFRSVPPRAPRSASTSGNSMVCVDCFQAKGENELRIPCQNPNCHFYLQAPGASKMSIPPAHRSTSISEASFNPWSPFTGGYDQQQADSNPPHYTIPATPHASSLWAYPASSMLSKKSIQKQRTQSVCFENEREKIKSGRYLRSRLMSLPMSEVLEQVETSDMVEDAFVSTPLFRGEEGKVTFLYGLYTYVLASYHVYSALLYLLKATLKIITKPEVVSFGGW